LGADLIEVRAPRYGRGILSYLRAGYDSVTNKRPDISISGAAPDTFDFVLLAAPVWAAHASTPMRAYLEQHKGKFKRAAFVLTCGGQAPQTAFDEMSADAGVKPDKTFELRQRDVKAATGLPDNLATFLASVRLKLAA
jgi:hypothetical protein